MNSIWYSLVWKEWHEHKWKLVSMVAIMWGAAALVFAFLKLDDSFPVAISMVGLCILPLSMFIGLGAAASERSRNTLPFLQSLPAPLWRVAVVKVVLGLLSLFAAIGLALALLSAWKYGAELAGLDTGRAMQHLDDRDMKIGLVGSGSWYVDCFILLAAFAAGVFAWSAAAGVNRRDEISAGAMAVIVVVGWGLLLAIAFSVLAYWFIDFSRPYYSEKWAWLSVVALSTLPGGIFPASTISYRVEPAIHLALTCVTAAATYSALLASYVYRFGKLKNAEIRSRQTAGSISAQAEWLSSPRQSPTTAIIWKQIRESGPIALAGVAGSVGITTVIVLVDAVDRRQLRPDFIAEVYPKMAVMFGCFVALVAGIGVCINDVAPKVNEFWRSRPIPPNRFFWIKFATGIGVVLASTYVPIGALAALQLPVFKNWDFPDAFTIPAIQLAVFAAAVATTCLVRQAVYAAILSIAVVYLGTLFGIAICLLPAWLQGEHVNLLTDPTSPQVAFGLATSFAISTLLAWLAVRHDWGKKSRY